MSEKTESNLFKNASICLLVGFIIYAGWSVNEIGNVNKEKAVLTDSIEVLNRPPSIHDSLELVRVQSATIAPVDSAVSAEITGKGK